MHLPLAKCCRDVRVRVYLCVCVCIGGGGRGKESESVYLRASRGRSMVVVDGTGGEEKERPAVEV